MKRILVQVPEEKSFVIEGESLIIIAVRNGQIVKHPHIGDIKDILDLDVIHEEMSKMVELMSKEIAKYKFKE